MATPWIKDNDDTYWLDCRDIGMKLEVFEHRGAWLVACYTPTTNGWIWQQRFKTREEAMGAAEAHVRDWTPIQR
jgi:hypothetical protein